MIESFVDLTYRGLALGRRIKLTQVRPSTGYLELPLPMPVGTQLSIGTDDGIVLEATVVGLHEQVGGSDRTPGMTVRPELGDPASATAAWWQARVALPELDDRPTEPPRAKQVTMVRPRPKPQPVSDTDRMAPLDEPAAAPVAAPPPIDDAVPVPQVDDDPHPVVDDGKPTTIMNAVEQELLEQLSSNAGEVERLTRISGEHPVADDGKPTIVMETVDVSALGLEPVPAPEPGDDDDTNGSAEPRRRKKRKTKQ